MDRIYYDGVSPSFGAGVTFALILILFCLGKVFEVIVTVLFWIPGFFLLLKLQEILPFGMNKFAAILTTFMYLVSGGVCLGLLCESK